jgi:hypothetical protein
MEKEKMALLESLRVEVLVVASVAGLVAELDFKSAVVVAVEVVEALVGLLPNFKDTTQLGMVRVEAEAL